MALYSACFEPLFLFFITGWLADSFEIRLPRLITSCQIIAGR